MAIPNLSDEQMRRALKELEQALYNHEQWAEMIYGTLICRLAPDQRDLGTDAHRKCRFGQWYYGSGTAILGGYPGVAEVGAEHEHMHQHAARLLRSTASGVPISINDFERFVTALKRMRLEVTTVQREIEKALYGLDVLTGMPGRIGMLTELREQHELVKRTAHPCVVAMMDLDHFKAVNDTYGHLVGDKVLTSVARHVMAHLRPYDKVYRYGGEEFLICLPDTDLLTGHEITDRLARGIGALLHDVEGNTAFNITVSIGLAALEPEILVEQAIERADRAVYAAKTSGRNCVVTWSATMDASPDQAKASASKD